METGNLVNKGRRGGLTAGILLLVTVYGFTNTFQSVVMNRVVESYGLTGGQQGAMSSMINVGCIAAMLAAPFLQGRIRKMLLLLGATVLQVIGFFALGIQDGFAAMLIISILLGLGFGLTDTCCNSAMVDVHPVNSSFFLGLLHGAFGVGSLLCPLIVSALLALMMWQRVSRLLALLALITVLVFGVILLVFDRGSAKTAPEKRLTARDIRSFLGTPRNLLFVAAGVMYAATQTALTVWLVRYMTLRYNAESLGATALSIYWITATISRFLAPRIRVRPLKLFLTGALLSCLFQTVGVLGGSPILMCVMVGCIGLVSGQCLPMLLGECTQGYEGLTALPTSVLLFTMCIARILVPLLMGVICDGLSISIAMLLPVATGLLAGISAFLALRTKASEAA